MHPEWTLTCKQPGPLHQQTDMTDSVVVDGGVRSMLEQRDYFFELL